MIDNISIRVLGQASFLVIVVATANPPAAPIVKVFYEAVYAMLFVCSSWLWYVIASRIAVAVRRTTYSPQSLSLPSSAGFVCASTPEQCFRQAIFQGVFVEARSSVVFGVFFYIGASVLLYIKAKFPARLFSVIFGIISMTIPFSYGPLFPYWYPILGEVFVVPIGGQLAIGLVASIIFWPSTMNHVYTKQIQGVLATIKCLAQTQRDILASDLHDKLEWDSYATIKEQVRDARTGFSAFGPNDAFLDKEIHVSRLGASDLREITQMCRDVCLKLGGFSTFYDLVSHHMSIPEMQGEKARSSHDEEKYTSASHSQSPSGAATPITPGSEDESLGHHHLDQVSDRLRNSNEATRHKKHKHAHFKLNSSVTDLLHTALHHQYKPVGVFEMHQYTEREQKFPRNAELDLLRKMMAIVSQESRSLYDALITALEVNCEYLTVMNKDRFYNKYIFKKKPKDMEESLMAARDALQYAWDAFDKEGRLKMISVYDNVNNNDYHGKTPHRPLLRMFYLEFHIMRFSFGVLTLTRKILELEKKKKSPKLRFPTVFFFLKRSKHAEESRASLTQDEHQGGEEFEGGMISDADDYETEIRDPDHDPPRHVGHLIGQAVFKFFSFFQNPFVFFAMKAAVLVVLVALPGYLSSTAGWFYEHRGLWAIIMAALTQAPFTGDTIFTFIWRAVGTFVGAVLGMLAWYVGNGNGSGNPYGLGATMAVLFPVLMYIRLKFVYVTPQPAIILVITFGLIIGYSWQDSHLPSQVNIGVGWSVAWRRFLVVLIGITAAFIWTFIPKPTTGRQVIRRRLAFGVFEIGKIYIHVSNFARHPHPTIADEEEIRQMVVRANTKLLVLQQRLMFVDFEPPIQGPWPKKKYEKIWDLQRELLDLMVAFVNNLMHMSGSTWRTALLRRTGWFDRQLIGDCLAVLFMTANAIKTGGALPQLVPCPLLDRFASRMNAIQGTHKEGSLPQHLTQETLEDPGYASFAVGSVISFAIIKRVDALMTMTKELVGERWQSAHCLPRHEYERLQNA